MLSFLGGMLVMLMTLVSARSGSLGKVTEFFLAAQSYPALRQLRQLRQKHHKLESATVFR